MQPDFFTSTFPALHVIKGAIQKVLGTQLATSIYAEGNKGRITV